MLDVATWQIYVLLHNGVWQFSWCKSSLNTAYVQGGSNMTGMICV
jgi:hypothetical protein